MKRLPLETYMVASLPPVVDSELTESLQKLAFRAHTLLAGPKGSGKSLALRRVAHDLKVPYVTLDGAEDVRRSALAGIYTLRGGDTEFLYGAVTTACDLAMEHGKCILALEEVNALPGSVQKMINPLTDFRSAWDVPEAGLSFRLKGPAQLWVVGTLNYVGEGGIYDLNPDLKSRFRMLAVPYPDAKEEQQVLRRLFPKAPQADLKRLVNLAKETRTGDLGYELSTRDLVGVLEDMQAHGAEFAFQCLLGKFDPGVQAAFSKRVSAAFRVSPARVT